MVDFEHEIELDDIARERWMMRQRGRTVVRNTILEFDGHGKLVRR